MDSSLLKKPRNILPKPSADGMYDGRFATLDRASGTQRSQRKVSHSAIEKRRRERFNHRINVLKRLIPACHGPKSEAIHKLDVLERAIEYIVALKHNLGEDVDMDALEAMVAVDERSQHSN
jgi:hypothetical protein